MITLLLSLTLALGQETKLSFNGALDTNDWNRVREIIAEWEKDPPKGFTEDFGKNSPLVTLMRYTRDGYRYGKALTAARLIYESKIEAEWGGFVIRAAASADHHGRMLERILSYGANPDWSDPNGYFHGPLRSAVSGMRPANTLLMLKAGADPNVASGRDRWCPLHEAASRGLTDISQALLKAGADPNPKNAVGQTPLHLAAANDHAEVIGVLLRAGADRKMVDAKGQTALQIALKTNKPRAAKALRRS